jgi:hypothetical protein
VEQYQQPCDHRHGTTQKLTFVVDALTAIILFDDVIDVGHSRRHEKSKDERDNEVLTALLEGVRDARRSVTDERLTQTLM